MNHTFTEFINKISQYLLQIPRNSDAFFWVSEFNNLNTTNIPTDENWYWQCISNKFKRSRKRDELDSEGEVHHSLAWAATWPFFPGLWCCFLSNFFNYCRWCNMDWADTPWGFAPNILWNVSLIHFNKTDFISDKFSKNQRPLRMSLSNDGCRYWYAKLRLKNHQFRNNNGFWRVW